MDKKTTKDTLIRLCVSGMFAALICVATMLIQIPTPITKGYLNFGDCFILVAAWVLGPVYGFAAGGIGSALADLLTGYTHYVPGTFVIKGLVAVAALIVRAFLKRSEKLRFPGYVVGGITGEIIMVGGYYLYAATVLGKGFLIALDSVFGNVVQGAFGVVVGVILIEVIAKTHVLKRFGAYAV